MKQPEAEKFINEAGEKKIEQPQTPVEKYWDNFEKTVEVELTEKAKQEAKIAERWDNLEKEDHYEGEAKENVPVERRQKLNESDIDKVFNGLDKYDLDGKDYNKNPEQLKNILEGFSDDKWKNMDLDGKKEQIRKLGDYINDVLEIKKPPDIKYYNVRDKGNCGRYNHEINTVSINEYILDDPKEAVDTAAHELWHAYQHEKASDPQSTKDFMYKFNFENYIRPSDDFDGYRKQLVEAEARTFADQFKGALTQIGKV